MSSIVIAHYPQSTLAIKDFVDTVDLVELCGQKYCPLRPLSPLSPLRTPLEYFFHLIYWNCKYVSTIS